jgi:hypothetical protein
MLSADEKTSVEPIKFTRAMIEAAGKAIWLADPLIDISNTWAEHLFMEGLKRAAAVGHIEIDVEQP